MGTDDLFKKRRAERQKRKHEFKSVNTNSFLIVTEGEKTEPLYFKGLQKKINEKINGRIDIVESPVIDIFGQGCSTSRLIESTEEIVKDSNVFYQNIWDGTYHKNCEEIFNLVNQYDGVNTAIKNAKRRMDGFREGKDVPSEYDPGTTVYKVVEELMGYLEE